MLMEQRGLKIPNFRTVTLDYLNSKSSGAILDLRWTKEHELCVELSEAVQGTGCRTTNFNEVPKSEEMIWSFENYAYFNLGLIMFTSTLELFTYSFYLQLSIN